MLPDYSGPNLFTRIIAGLILFVFTGSIFAQSFGSSMPSGMDSDQLERYLDQADLARSREEWERIASFGVESVVAEWEYDFFLDPDYSGDMDVNEARDIVENTVEERYADWLIESFFNFNVETESYSMNRAAESANKEYLYELDSEGNIQFDEYGDPLLYKTESLDSDLIDYESFMDSQIIAELDSFTENTLGRFAELLPLISDDNKEYLESNY
ncbi:MAG: hypothetical protein GY756_26875, partial [bacterium]|nr:hypothetical protein [bacterium]